LDVGCWMLGVERLLAKAFGVGRLTDHVSRDESCQTWTTGKIMSG